MGVKYRWADGNLDRLPALASDLLKQPVDAVLRSDFPDLFRRAASYVDRIFKGVKPDDLPIEQPTKFELAISLKAANALRLTIPQFLLGRADQVIQWREPSAHD